MKKTHAFWGLVMAVCCLCTSLAVQRPSLSSQTASPIKETTQPPINSTQPMLVQPKLLSDPFLQLPTESSVQVVWFTEFEGVRHFVEYGDGDKTAATTSLLSRTYEDSASQLDNQTYPNLTRRPIWRHEATIEDLVPDERVRYRVASVADSGQVAHSGFFTLSAAPAVGQRSKILLTSDHQLKQMVPANLQKVEETVGQVDGVFFAGDLVNVPDRASEWFDGAKGLALFLGLQGRAQYALTKDDVTTVYKGGEIIQHAPLFPTIGNHEVMGQVSKTEPLNEQYKDALPRHLVRQFYPSPEALSQDVEENWIADHSYNTRTYEEIFSLPKTQLPTGKETQTYYATTFGDVRLVSLYVTRIWRSRALGPDIKGSYREIATDLDDPKSWGYGQHIFEDIRKGSPQYQWLQQELASEAFQNAKYKIVMMHHPPHTLGSNIVPAFTDPVMVKNLAEEGSLQSVQYEYPIEADYIVRDLVPLLEQAGVQLVFYGHSHLWNRFIGPTGMHFLETSNVGNSYGAHLEGNPRAVPRDEAVEKAGDLIPFQSVYASLNDPNGLTPVVPTIAPLSDESGEPLPYIASNDITSFTIFDTGDGTLSSYYFDTRQPDSDVVKFDQFTIGQ